MLAESTDLEHGVWEEKTKAEFEHNLHPRLSIRPSVRFSGYQASFIPELRLRARDVPSSLGPSSQASGQPPRLTPGGLVGQAPAECFLQ